MTMYNKKPGAFLRPGKDKSPKKRITPEARERAWKRELHRKIAAQSLATKSGGPYWRPSQYPELYALIETAKREANRRKKGRFYFSHHGKSYEVNVTSLGRAIVKDRRTGEFIASTGFFAL